MRGSGARSPVKPLSCCDIQHHGVLLTAHQCLVECFVYNLILEQVKSMKSCGVLGSEELLTDYRVFHCEVVRDTSKRHLRSVH